MRSIGLAAAVAAVLTAACGGAPTMPETSEPMRVWVTIGADVDREAVRAALRDLERDAEGRVVVVEGRGPRQITIEADWQREREFSRTCGCEAWAQPFGQGGPGTKGVGVGPVVLVSEAARDNIEKVVLHEVAHLFGLLHDEAKGVVMAPWPRGTEMSAHEKELLARAIAADDDAAGRE